MLDEYLQFARKRWMWFRYSGALERSASLAQFHRVVAVAGDSTFEGYEQWDPVSRRDFSAVLDTLGIDLKGKSFLDIGPGYGSALDVARERNAARTEFVDYDPFVCAFNKLKGHFGQRLDVRRNLSMLYPRKFDFIWLKATFSADRFLARDSRLAIRSMYPRLEQILREIDALLAPGGTVVFCPHWQSAEGRRNVEQVRDTPVATSLTQHGYRQLPWIENHNMEPLYPITFAKTLRDESMQTGVVS